MISKEKKKDFKIFLMYTFNPKGLTESLIEQVRKLFEPNTLIPLLILVAFVSLIYLKYPVNVYNSILLFIVALIIKIKQVYKGGEHRHWYKVKKGLIKK